jgi:tyrosine-protein phosphatase 2/3
MHLTKVPLPGDQIVKIRTLMLENRDEPFASIREVVQLHYEGWPDFGTPAQPATIVGLVKLLNEVISQRQKGKNPSVVIHCSAGCGRTGTFVVVDSLINYFERERDLGDEKDLIQESVLALREQRMSLVQTLRQYVLCYESILHEVVEIISDNRVEEMSVG